MSLEDVKTLVKGDESQLNVIYRMTEKRLLGKLKRSLKDVSVVPDELDYIVDEVTISRFNRIGSEGMSSESVEGHSATYSDNDFKAYQSDIDEYIDSIIEPVETERRGKVWFI